MKKANHKTDRRSIDDFQQIINIGPAIADDFYRLGLDSPQRLIGANPLRLYQQICATDNLFHDPCVLDCFLAAVDYMDGNPPQQWWAYTKRRKENHTADVDALRQRYPRP